VIHGQARGRTIGVPTANLDGVVEALPPYGVYAVLVDQVEAGVSRALGVGVANIGVRPTLSAGFSAEVHLFDFDADLYGQTLRVHLLSRLRGEQKFAGIVELRAQIARDIAEARAVLATAARDPAAQGAWY
jgi:riboflavin kinase/FMN adenylyltransferase